MLVGHLWLTFARFWRQLPCQCQLGIVTGSKFFQPMTSVMKVSIPIGPLTTRLCLIVCSLYLKMCVCVGIVESPSSSFFTKNNMTSRRGSFRCKLEKMTSFEDHMVCRAAHLLGSDIFCMKKSLSALATRQLLRAVKKCQMGHDTPHHPHARHTRSRIALSCLDGVQILNWH